MNFLSPEVALYLYKLPYGHTWDITPRCYWEVLEKLLKQLCKIVGLFLLPPWNLWLLVAMQAA